MTVPFALTLTSLGFAGAFIAGMLGVGGAIVMVPLLLYVPSLLGLEGLEMKAVSGITMVQVLAAAASGVIAHHRMRAVHGELAGLGGLSMAAGTFAGALASHVLSDRALLRVFALMATAALLVLFVPMDTAGQPIFAEHVVISRPRAVAVCLIVGVAAGLVGAGGAFLLVPLLIVVVGVPIRVTIGSSLAITAMSAIAGFAGKAATGQIPWGPALLVALAALPGAQLGALLSRRLSGARLRHVLFLVVLLTALRVWWDLLRP
ncbi:MAG: sulfite exporter TauE/SafE family protein [Candidatus Rokuibacteriota bacterium]|nr:MAG: sulfite exporter TauE/SafE family protein [Candidatus Rokubacteria bacterium]